MLDFRAVRRGLMHMCGRARSAFPEAVQRARAFAQAIDYIDLFFVEKEGKGPASKKRRGFPGGPVKMPTVLSTGFVNDLKIS